MANIDNSLRAVTRKLKSLDTKEEKIAYVEGIDLMKLLLDSLQEIAKDVEDGDYGVVHEAEIHAAIRPMIAAQFVETSVTTMTEAIEMTAMTFSKVSREELMQMLDAGPRH